MPGSDLVLMWIKAVGNKLFAHLKQPVILTDFALLDID
jgi:hypothetical protein